MYVKLIKNQDSDAHNMSEMNKNITVLGISLKLVPHL